LLKIPLTKGKVALIDESDAHLIAAHKWHVVRTTSTTYARTKVAVIEPDGKRREINVYMHRLLALSTRGTDRGKGGMRKDPDLAITRSGSRKPGLRIQGECIR
jgi:hypothetical protein